MDGKEILFVLQKFGLEILILAGVISLICFLINKYAPACIKKFAFYYPYLLGVIFYFIYVKIFKIDCQPNGAFNMGITTGAVSAIISSFIKGQNGKKNLAEHLLDGLISEKDLKTVKSKISQTQDKRAIAEILSDYSVFPISADQAEIFAEIISFNTVSG